MGQVNAEDEQKKKKEFAGVGNKSGRAEDVAAEMEARALAKRKPIVEKKKKSVQYKAPTSRSEGSAGAQYEPGEFDPPGGFGERPSSAQSLPPSPPPSPPPTATSRVYTSHWAGLIGTALGCSPRGPLLPTDAATPSLPSSSPSWSVSSWFFGVGFDSAVATGTSLMSRSRQLFSGARIASPSLDPDEEMQMARTVA